MASHSAQVLYLSYDGLTDPLGQSQILPYLAGLSPDYEITVISFEKQDAFVSGKKLIQEFCEKNNLVWVPMIYHKKPPVLSTLYDVIALRKKIKSLHEESSFSIVHCRSYITALAGLWMKRKYGVKFIFDMRGFWADERVDGKIWNLKNPVYKIIYNFFKKKEKQFFQEADHVISLTNNAREEILAWGIRSSVTVIPCCVDLEHFDPDRINQIERENLKNKLHIRSSDKVLLYLGSWGTWYMTRELLDFFSELKKSVPALKFLIVTGDRIELGTLPFASDVIVAKATRKEVPLYISLADVSVFFIKPVFSKKASSATKMGEIMAMNIPVVTNPGWGDAEEIIKAAGGYLYAPGNELPADLFQSLGQQTRSYCMSNLSLNLAVKRYAELYRSLNSVR
jgi:glycosyltransferase involved in cell wall biosynthesis